MYIIYKGSEQPAEINRAAGVYRAEKRECDRRDEVG